LSLSEPSPTALLVVVHALPEAVCALRGKERVEAQRAAARGARAEAARLAGAGDVRFEQADDGKPLPAGPWHWSLSHGGDLVAAVVHTAPVGVDVERIADRRPEVVQRIVREHERAFLPAVGGFTRAWTAKEAVLKATQLGLSGLGRVRIVGTMPAGIRANVQVTSATAHWLGAESHVQGRVETRPRARPFDEELVLELDARHWHVVQLELRGHVLAVTAH
jgi:phosphopantetheinyl transferase